MRRYLGMLLATVMFAPTAAAAHSNSVETVPPHGATLETLPAEVAVTFEEAPKTADVVLTTPDGRVHVLTTRIDGSTVKAPVPSDGPRGSYGLSYRVVSADGHPVSGSSSFTVTTGPEASPKPTGSPVIDSKASASDDTASQPAWAFPVPTIIVLGVAVVALLALALVAARIKRR